MNFLSKLFLGKWWHWLLMVIITLLLWQAGEIKMHVRNFNWFLIFLLLGSLASVMALIYGTPSGEQITREKLEDADEAQPSGIE